MTPKRFLHLRQFEKVIQDSWLSASRFISNHDAHASRSDSSRTSEMPSIFFV